MKRASDISAISSTSLIFLGVLMKIFHLPGGSALLLFGVLGLALVFNILYAIANFQQENLSQIMFYAFGAGLVAISSYPIGVLWRLLSWPGVGLQLGLGIAALVIFSALFVIGKFHKNSADRKLSYSDKFLFISITLLTIGVLVVKPSSESRKEYIMKAELIDRQKSAILEQNTFLISKLKEHILLVKTDSIIIADKFNRLDLNVKAFLFAVNSIRSQLISHCEGLPLVLTDTISLKSIGRLSNYDISSYVLIGPDPENVNGIANDLGLFMDSYRDSIKSISGVDLQDTKLNTKLQMDGKGRELSWAVARFYHSELGNTLLELQLTELACLKSETEVLKALLK
jgi:hypothetical protein